MLMLAKFLLGPVLLAQGWRVRRTIVKLPEPVGKRHGQTGASPVMSVLILGDSAAAGVGVDSQEDALSGQLCKHLQHQQDVRWQLLAQTGRTTQDTLDMLALEPPRPIDTVLISLGVNDVTSGLSLEQYREQTQALIALLRSKFSARQIIFSGLPPVSRFPALPHPLRWYLGSVSKRFDRALRTITERHECDYLFLDMAEDIHLIAADGFHPGPQVYARWGQAAAILISARSGKAEIKPQSASI